MRYRALSACIAVAAMLLLSSCAEDSAASLDAFWLASGPARELYRMDRDTYEVQVRGYLNTSLSTLAISEDYKFYGIESVTQILVSVDALNQRASQIRDLVEVTDARALCFDGYHCYLLDQGQRVLRINPETGIVLSTWTLNRPHQDYVDMTVARGGNAEADVLPGDLLLLRADTGQSRIYRVRLSEGSGAVREICTTSPLSALATSDEGEEIYALSEDASSLLQLTLPSGNLSVLAYTDLSELENASLTLP